MNKRALEEYALFARKELEDQITLSLNKLGIYESKVFKANIVGDLTIIEGSQETFPKRVYALRESILNNLKLEERKFSSAVEEYAYTWFNRIIAIRFMEVHNYFDHGFKVLTSSDGSYEPDILKNVHYLIDDDKLNLSSKVVAELKEQNKTEELYRYILFKQCNALNSILPEMFDNEASYMELLLPSNLLSQDSIIRKLEIIPEEDFKNDIEVVGWLYQFYNSQKKKIVESSDDKIDKDTLPAVTQLFTPDWIVRYMVQNSVGRLWLENKPDSRLKNEFDFYVDDVKQDVSYENILSDIKYKNVRLEDIKIIEPCCGSGHILVYIFEILFKMYKESLYPDDVIPGLILKNNLFGLDVDKRACQLSKFSLIMKARSIDKRFFNKGRFVKPRVFEIIDSKVLIETNYKENMKSLNFSKKSIETAEYLVSTFENAKVIGSLLSIEKREYAELLDDIERCKSNEIANLLENEFYDYGLSCLIKLAVLAMTMSRKYDVLVTNPPYRPITDFEQTIREYATTYYPDSKYDLFSMFMDTNYVKKGGFTALINMHSWMFIKSFNKIRLKMINKYFVNVLHLGKHAFDSIPGEFVQTVSFVYRNIENNDCISVFIDDTLVYGEEEKKNNFKSAKRYTLSINNFKYTSGNAFSYWISENVLKNYKNRRLGEVGTVMTGMTIGDNEKYLRFWYEVDYSKIAIDAHEMRAINLDKTKWIPYSKGGLRVNWYGGYDYVVNWSENKNFNRAKTTMKDFYLRKAITWPFISGNHITAKILPEGFLWDVAGSPCFFDNEKVYNYVLALLVSKISDIFVFAQNPTNNVQSNDIACIPYLQPDDIIDEINDLVKDCISISKKNWDFQELSWNFKICPLLEKNSRRIEDAVALLKEDYDKDLESLRSNEERINKLLLEKYGLISEYDYKMTNDSITLYSFNYDNFAYELISYLIGVLMGRYSIENKKLNFAGRNIDIDCSSEWLDDDGIIPIYQFIGIENGLTSCICNLIKSIFGETYYKENLDFIANNLNRKVNEGAEEAINRYLNDSFYSNHLKVYQKRPIYWMLSSGKQGAFKCLVYMHRFTKNTLAAVNSKYFLPRTAMYKAERERLEFKLQTADVRDKKKLEQELLRVEACEQELLEYGQVLDHVANQCLNGEITIDLDDGVKNNYVKFQNISLEVNGATIKKNLLVPFGLESEKKKK